MVFANITTSSSLLCNYKFTLVYCNNDHKTKFSLYIIKKKKKKERKKERKKVMHIVLHKHKNPMKHRHINYYNTFNSILRSFIFFHYIWKKSQNLGIKVLNAS